MYTQSRTKAVPYGFICGYPVGGVSSELYGYYEGQGGKSGRQGEAVVEAMKKWGEGEAGTAGGTELGFAVCKRGYKPFGDDGERMYGCGRHHNMRLEAMRQKPPAAPTAKRGKGAAASTSTSTGAGGAGKDKDKDNDGLYHRPGWERFDQWIFGEKICVSSSSEQMSDEEDEDEDDDEQAASPAKKATTTAKAL